MDREAQWHFNTSHVSINHNPDGTILKDCSFQYISCFY